MTVIDVDSHLYEPRGMWADHIDRARRDLALEIVDDEYGYSWLTFQGERIEVLGIHDLGNVAQSGDFRLRLEQHLPPQIAYDDMPRDFWSPADRLATLTAFGIDEAVLLPNCGIMWERALKPHLEAMKANMEAWNRWAIDVAAEGNGRLHPVGHLTLRDPAWFEQQVRQLAAAGIRLVMIAPALADGRRLSHPDHERCWAALADNGVGVAFHIAQYDPVFDDAWNEGDPDWSNPVLSSVFMWTAPAVALADLAVRGVFARHPGLRVGVIELMSAWFPQFLKMVDGGFAFHAQFNGRPLTEMELKPSEYLTRQVRLASFPFEHADRLAAAAGEVFMFGSDYPHPEGVARPVPDFVAATGLQPDDAAWFYRDNAAWLLGR